MSDKLSPFVVLYFSPKQIIGNNGAGCGECELFIADINKCRVVRTPEKFNANWVCALLVPGKTANSKKHSPENRFSPSEVGLVNYRTSCGGVGTSKPCEYFLPDKKDCLKVDKSQTSNKLIESGGCCNRHEKEDKAKSVSLFYGGTK